MLQKKLNWQKKRMFGVLLYIFFVCLTTTNWFYMKNSVHTFISNYESWHKLRFNDSFFCCSTVFRHFSVISMALSVFWLLQTTTGVALESKNYTFLKFARNKKQRTLNILTIYCRRDQLFFCLHSPVGSSFCMQSGKVKKNNRTTVPCTVYRRHHKVKTMDKWKKRNDELKQTHTRYKSDSDRNRDECSYMPIVLPPPLSFFLLQHVLCHLNIFHGCFYSFPIFCSVTHWKKE